MCLLLANLWWIRYPQTFGLCLILTCLPCHRNDKMQMPVWRLHQL